VSQGPTRVQRLVRLNQFREELASGTLRKATAQQHQAQDAHMSATAAVEGIGEWKLRGHAGGLDLAMYGAALNLESLAMVRADESKQALSDSEQRTDQAKQGLIGAACAMRVSENRGKREQAVLDGVREKQIFDQISDVWLNNREGSHD